MIGYTLPMKNLAVMSLLFWLSLPTFADPIEDVRCREIAFSTSVENQDIGAFKSFIDSDARFVSNSVLNGPEEIATAWQMFFADDGPSIVWRPQFVEVLDDGALALTRGPYRVIAKDAEGNAVESWGTFNSIWRKNENGEWHVVFDAGSESAKPPSDETLAMLQQEDDC